MKQVHGEMSFALVALLFCSLFGQAQQAATVNSATIVPSLVNFSGVLTGSNGRPLTSIVGVTKTTKGDNDHDCSFDHR